MMVKIICAFYCILFEKNDELPPKPFQIFLKGGSGIGKNFLITAITTYLTQCLRYLNQSLDQPSVFVTASTGKAATGVNGITLHTAFHLAVKSGLKSHVSDEILHLLRNKYCYLKVLIINEISMTGREIFKHLCLASKVIMQYLSQFDVVSLLVVELVLCYNVSNANIIEVIDIPRGIPNCTGNGNFNFFIGNSVPYAWSFGFFSWTLFH